MMRGAASGRLLEEKLFDNAAALKMDTSRLAMYLPQEWRDSIRRQIDSLLAIDSWEEDSSEINLASFRTFLRFVVYAAPSKLPSLGVSVSGNLLAAWYETQDRISVEFLPSDKAKAFLVLHTGQEPQAVAWHGEIIRLRGFIERIGTWNCLQ